MEKEFGATYADLWNRGRPAWGEAQDRGLVWYAHETGDRCSRIDGLIVAVCVVSVGDVVGAYPDAFQDVIDDNVGDGPRLCWCVRRVKVTRLPWRLPDVDVEIAARGASWDDLASARAWLDERIPLGGR